MLETDPAVCTHAVGGGKGGCTLGVGHMGGWQPVLHVCGLLAGLGGGWGLGACRCRGACKDAHVSPRTCTPSKAQGARATAVEGSVCPCPGRR